jgi:hypothetical protein
MQHLKGIGLVLIVLGFVLIALFTRAERYSVLGVLAGLLLIAGGVLRVYRARRGG